jgi:hypothetical protein
VLLVNLTLTVSASTEAASETDELMNRGEKEPFPDEYQPKGSCPGR